MSSIVYDYMDWPRIEAVVYGEEPNPKDVMGPQLTKDGVLVQGFFPGADRVEILTGKDTFEAELQDEAGYFAAMLPYRKIPFYKFRVTKDKKAAEFYDPYAFESLITENDEKIFLAGVSYHIYDILGAHPASLNKINGTNFAVWAPNALSVSVVGDFNNWDDTRHMMHRKPMSGIYELFVPEAKNGELYKFRITLKSGEKFLKADPYAVCSLEYPDTASVITDNDLFKWDDGEWMSNRKKTGNQPPVCIYETNLSRWKNPEELIDYVKDLHYTHVELEPVMSSTGDPHNTFAYYAVDKRLGGSDTLKSLINGLHKNGVGVILDWVPSHFPKHLEGLEKFDGTSLYENPDPSMAVHPMWGTFLYNYESPMVADFLLGNAFYWIEEFHADGLRLDDVDCMLYLDFGKTYGQWTPNIYGGNENLAAAELLKHFNSIIHKKIPGTITIAQEDGLWDQLTDSVENDHIGFDYKWNNSWTGDFLEYLKKDPAGRKEAHDQLTLSMLYTYCEHYVLTLGLRDVGSLDEFLKLLPGTEKQKLAQLRTAYTYQYLHPGCVMNAPDRELPQELKSFIKDLNNLYLTNPALSQKDNEYEGFEWIQLMNYEQNTLAFLRTGAKQEDTLLAVVNFSGEAFESYQVGVPFYGKYKEIFNSDKKEYGGENIINPRAKTCRSEEFDEREYSVKFRIPAFGAAIFSCTPQKKPAKQKTQKKSLKASAKSVTKKTSAKTAEKKTKK